MWCAQRRRRFPSPSCRRHDRTQVPPRHVRESVTGTAGLARYERSLPLRPCSGQAPSAAEGRFEIREAPGRPHPCFYAPTWREPHGPRPPPTMTCNSRGDPNNFQDRRRPTIASCQCSALATASSRLRILAPIRWNGSMAKISSMSCSSVRSRPSDMIHSAICRSSWLL